MIRLAVNTSLIEIGKIINSILDFQEHIRKYTFCLLIIRLRLGCCTVNPVQFTGTGVSVNAGAAAIGGTTLNIMGAGNFNLSGKLTSVSF